MHIKKKKGNLTDPSSNNSFDHYTQTHSSITGKELYRFYWQLAGATYPAGIFGLGIVNAHNESDVFVIPNTCGVVQPDGGHNHTHVCVYIFNTVFVCVSSLPDGLARL